MNIYTAIAGCLAGFTTAGHFAVGTRLYLNPMLSADFDQVSKKVMHCVFHYVSTFLVISSLALLSTGFGLYSPEGFGMVVKFISINYALFALWQIGLAMNSGIDTWPIKLFQWTLFLLIATLGWIGS